MDNNDGRSLAGRATAAEPVVSALRDGIPSALSPTDAFILETYNSGASVEVVAQELRVAPHYIYVRQSVLRKRFKLPARIRAKHVVRRRIEDAAPLPPGAKQEYQYLDWRLIKDLTDDGATEGEIAEFFSTTIAAVRSAKRAARTAGARAKSAERRG